jgi:hypothetical protein
MENTAISTAMDKLADVQIALAGDMMMVSTNASYQNMIFSDPKG